MFTSNRKFFSSERGSATSWLAAVTATALLIGTAALPAVADEAVTASEETTASAPVEPTALAEETPATAEETAAAAEEAVIDEPVEDVAPVDEPAASAEEAVIDVPIEDEAPATDPSDQPAEEAPDLAEEPAASETPAESPTEDPGTAASSTDGETPDANSPPVEEFVPGITVESSPATATIAWPEFGLDENYAVQMEKNDGNWKTLDAEVGDADSTIRDYEATIDGLKPGKEYRVRIVTAETQELAVAATEAAVDMEVAGPGLGSMVRSPGNSSASPYAVASQEVIVALAPLPNAPVPNTISLRNWETKAPASWIDGTLNGNNSTYAEGQVVPFELDLGNLPTGYTWIAPICRDYLISTVYGYTSLEPFDTTVPAVSTGGAATALVGPFSGVGIQNLTIDETGASIGSLGGQSYDCGSTQRLTIVTFEVTGSGNKYLLWGGRLSAPGDTNPDVDYTKSASFVSGGSLQMRLASPDKTAGINPSAIIPQLPILKYNDLDASGGPLPAPSEPGIEGWTIFIDLDNDGVLDSGEVSEQTGSDPRGYAYLAMQPGTTYRLCEVPQEGWANTQRPGVTPPAPVINYPGTVCGSYVASLRDVAIFGNTLQPGTLQLVKKVVNDDGGAATVAAFGVNTSAGALVFGSGVENPADTFTYTATPLTVNAGSYTLRENDIAGYTEGTWSCTGATANPTSITAGAVIVPNGGNVVCTITNDDVAGTLQLVKKVVNDDGGAATVAAFGVNTSAGALVFGSGVENPADTFTYTATPLTVNAGSYTLRENDIAGYTEGTWSCTGATANPTSITAGAVIVPNGGNVVCTITNDDVAGTLQLVKKVVNDDGGTATVAAFGVNTSAGALVFGSGVENPADTFTYTATPLTVNAGSYTLRENDIAGYTEGTWSCTGATANPTSITAGAVIVPNGGNVVCTITNDDVAPELKLVKVVNNLDSDSTKIPDNWTLYAEAADAELDDRDFDNAGGSGGVETVYAGVEYGLSEDPAPNAGGYSSTGQWTCEGTGFSLNDDNTGVTMEVGGSATCQITNTILVRDLTLEKVWVKGFAGDTAALSVDGTTDGSATSKAPDAPGEINTVTVPVYSGETVNLTEVLSEKSTGTYTTVLECKDSQGTSLMMVVGSTDSEFTMPVDAVDVTCTFTNTRTVGDLVIKKVVVGEIAGASTDFTVDVACGPESGFNHTGVVLNEANKWTATLTGINSGLSCVVTENSVPAGWKLTSISPSPAVIGGTPVTVTVTNTRAVGDLVVKKVVVGPIAGATTDFTVNVDCTPGTTYDKTGVVLNQANNWTVTYTGIPTGISCVVTEPVVPAGWTLTSISPTPAVIGGTPVTVTVTNTRNGIPGLDKTSAPADGILQVEPGDLINYSVTVSNTGGLPITGPVVDTLPAGLTVVATTISGGGTANAALTVITWQVVNLAPGATLTFTYQALVGGTVQTGDSLVNVVTFQGLQDSTATPVELPPVAGIEEAVVESEEEEIAATGANNVGNMVGAALLAMLAGGLMVTFGRRRRNQG